MLKRYNTKNAIEVSILMPVYNGHLYVNEAINSVLNQTYDNYEFIIINDGSTDSSEKIILEYPDNRIRYFRIEHFGLAFALNFGLRKCVGNYIARIDADDIWLPNKLQQQLNYLIANPDIGFLATSKQVINEKGLIIKECEPDTNLTHHEILQTLQKYNCICHSSVIFNRNVLTTIGYYNEKYKNSLDYEYWIRVLKERKGYLIGSPLVKYRISLKMLSIAKRQQQNFELIIIKLRFYKLQIFKWNLLRYIMLDFYRLIIPDFLIKLKKKFLS